MSDFKKLADWDPMPFGKYGPKQGDQKFMQDVPAKYLFWLWTDSGMQNQTETSAVADYIKRNLDALEKEYPNGIWRT